MVCVCVAAGFKTPGKQQSINTASKSGKKFKPYTGTVLHVRVSKHIAHTYIIIYIMLQAK